jgi:diadenosine tetraphosphatase ApaH/serine/threonine PP2A family protein phosphatase
MIRGNHECRLLTAHFTFLRETQKKYRSQRLYDEVMLLFDALPLGVIIEDEESRFLCVHGGLSPDLHTIDDISNVYRFQEPGKSGALCDLLWSDPLEEETAQGLSASDMQEWYEVRFEENASRGCGWIFGYAAAKEFIDRNNLTAIIRAHEVQRAGYGLNKFQKPTPETLVITVFSAPNYCDFYANKAAVMKISPPRYDTGDEADEHTRLEFVQFDNVPHPFLLPKLQDGIEYTMPFLVDKLKQILSYLISKKGLGEEDAEEKQFYGAIDQMMERHRIASSPSRQDSSEPSSSNAGRQRPSVPIPRSPSGRLLTHVRKITNPTPEKQFLSVKDRIDMLHKDAASKAELVKRLSETRGGLIQGKILQNRITAYLSKATSKFQRAKQEDWLNECRPDSN